MTPGHAGHAAHGAGGLLSLEGVLALCGALAAVLYLAGVLRSRRTGRPWPAHRAVLWCAGIAAATASAVGPLAAAAHESFTGHTVAHLLGGMLAPLLLVLAAPVTLALRTLEVTPARRITRLLRSRPARLIAHPVTAGLLSAGGLWLLQATPLLSALHADPLGHVLIQAHLLVSGWLLAAAVLRVDPAPHAPPRAVAGVVLALVMASHAVLAKQLYAAPPPGFAVPDVQAGAQLMYYGGGLLEAAMVALFCAGWYREAGRRRASLRRAPAAAADA